MDPAKVLGVGNHVDFDDPLPAIVRPGTTKRRPRGAATTPPSSIHERAVRTSRVPAKMSAWSAMLALHGPLYARRGAAPRSVPNTTSRFAVTRPARATPSAFARFSAAAFALAEG